MDKIDDSGKRQRSDNATCVIYKRASRLSTDTCFKNENPKKIEESSDKKNQPVKIAENNKKFENDKKFFKSVSPFDTENTEKDETGIKYKTQARFLSTKTEIKTPNINKNESRSDPNPISKSTKSNNKLQLEKESIVNQPKEQISSQFMFQDGPINLDIF
jgi:hypothetical protein